jgi:succinate dehydrogenase / fumarate reductase iron-sulfur subunit
MKKINLTINVWRQASFERVGKFKTYAVSDINPHMSFLEMLDVLNEALIEGGQSPVAFDHDCREGICGSCSLVINGHTQVFPLRGHAGGRL